MNLAQTCLTSDLWNPSGKEPLEVHFKGGQHFMSQTYFTYQTSFLLVHPRCDSLRNTVGVIADISHV